MTSNLLVPIIMGSKADLAHGQAIAKVLTALGVPSEIRVGSAHKAPQHVLRILEHYEAMSHAKVYITIAGRSNALSGFVDANVTSPVIACPPYGDKFGGVDIFSTLRMPSGVAPATVLEVEAAALLAAKILAVADADLRARVGAYQAALRATIEQDDRELRGNE